METRNISSPKRYARGTTSRRLKAACVLQLLVLLAVWLPAVARAQFLHTTNNGTITITGYTGPGGEVVIPDTINGLPVAGIGIWAFAYKDDLTSVAIPAGVVSIAGSAFSHCVNLTAIIVEPGNSTFSSADGVLFNKIQTTLFQCPGAKSGSYTIPSTVTSIETDAFSGCARLTSATIPDGLIGIGVGAFYDCTSLTSVSIPRSVSSIGYGAFSTCTRLTSITVDAANLTYSEVWGVLFNKNRTALICFPSGRSGDYALPTSVVGIDDDAFYGCSLASVTIPRGVTSIGDMAFADCRRLTSIAIPYSVTSMGDYAFNYCTGLTNLTIIGSITTLGVEVFSGCTNLISAVIGSGTTNIGVRMFLGCSSLSEVTIPASVTKIGNAGFAGCASLRNVTIPSTVTSIGERGFSGCARLDRIYIPSSVTGIGRYAFDGCASLTNVTISSSLTVIGSYVFSHCTSLASIAIPHGITRIMDHAFYYCTKLTSAVIPKSVVNIDDQAFAYCTNLNNVLFEGNAPFLGPLVFNADNAAAIYYLRRTTGWGPTFGDRPTALWLPQVSTGDARFGVRTNQFGFNINWASGRTVVVEAGEDLANPVWTPVGTNTLIEGTSYFSDPQWANTPARFYRLREP